MNSLLWHDYETTGISPARDRPVQFAAQHTDESLQPLGDPVTLYCRLPPDALPAPEACLVTGLLPQEITTKGVPEPEFAQQLHKLFSQPGTCGAGYNSIRFDDEVTRYTFWRNFIDPYGREWKQGNSRWDIIDMVRLVAFIKPDSLQWPRDDGDRISFRLERLSEANGIEHESAHDALSDVHATIGLARLILQREPGLYDYCWKLRDKRYVDSRLNWAEQRPFLHISGNLPADRGRAGLFMPLCRLKQNKNAFVAIELSDLPDDLLQLDEAEISRRIFSRSEELGEQGRLPIKQIYLNRSPVILPVNMLNDELARHWQFDLPACERNWQMLRNSDLIHRNWDEVFSFEAKEDADPDLDLYGGFLPDQDRRLAERVQSLLPDELRIESLEFGDPRMQQLLFRYRARNWPETLDDAEQQQWSDWLRGRLMQGHPYGDPLPELMHRCQQLMQQHPDRQALLQQLLDHYESLLAGLAKA